MRGKVAVTVFAQGTKERVANGVKVCQTLDMNKVKQV